MTIKFANNISTTLALGAGIAATSFDVASTTGFPTLGVGDYFYGTLSNTLGAIEIVQVTSWTGTTVTCTRGAEGTPPAAWSTGDSFEIRVTAAGLTTVLNATEVVEEVQTATSGQTVFTLTTFMYVPGENTLSVYVDGVNQIVDLSYTETGTTTVTFIAGLHLGALVKFTTLRTSGLTTSAAVVTYEPAGTGAVPTTVQAKLRESVSIADYSSLQAALNTGNPVEITAGTWTVTGGATAIANSYIYGAGTLQSDGTNPILTIPSGATGVTVDGVKLKGYRLTNESAAGDIGINVQESGVTIRNCEISYFASRGIELASQVASAFEYQSLITDNWIHHNCYGINTNAYEYCRIDGNKITKNGWSNAGTDFAPLSSSLGSGIYGNLANCPVTNNQITDNAFGIYLIAGSAAPNPDHSVIGFNAINHNGAAGLVLVDLKSYELVIGNTIISNVNQTAAVKYAPTGFTEDMALVNAHALVFTGNTVGVGSDTKIPIYGHARCRYTNNQFLYGPPTEVGPPTAGSPLYDTWGYGTNDDNIWRDNWFYAFSQPVLWATTTRVQISDNLENGTLVDGVAVSPTMAANWANVSPAYDPVKYWREGGDTVHVVGSVLPSAGAGTTAFTLPAGFRPLTGAIDAPAIITSAGAVGFARIYTNGVVEITGRTVGQTVVVNFTFRCKA